MIEGARVIEWLDGGDAASESPDPPATAPLRASIDAFTAALADAHPSIFTRSPVYDVEDVAALLHMYLDRCRELLAMYDALTSAGAVWTFEPERGEGDDDGEHEHEAGDGDDLPF